MSVLSFFLAVTGAALVDSVKPCAVAVLLLFAALLAVGKREKALRCSGFILSVYVECCLLGLGVFPALQVSGFYYYFHLLVGFLAIAVGAFNVKNFVWYGRYCPICEILTPAPEEKKSPVHKV